MSKTQMLRALVNERLTAADDGDEEEELCLSKVETQRRQQVLNPRVLLFRTCPDAELNQDFTETSWIKEEPKEECVTQEQELVPGSVPESSLLQKRLRTNWRTQYQVEKREEGISFYSETKTGTYEDCKPPLKFSTAPMETEADEDDQNKTQIRDRRTKPSPQNKSVQETSSPVHMGDLLRPYGRAERKKHLCPFCQKRLSCLTELQRHIRVHTGERPYNCSFCEKAFTQKSSLNSHIRTHTGEKPFSCTVCNKAFAYKYQLKAHASTHRAQSPDDNEMPSIGRIFQILSIPLQSI